MNEETLAGTVAALYRFPVKGLSPEPLGDVALKPGAGVQGDRALGFLRHETEYDADHPRPMEKTCFHMLARDAALARLATRYDPETDTLTIGEDRHALGTEAGRTAAETAIGAALGLGPERRPRLVRGGTAHRFTDVSVVSDIFMNAVSLINLASVADLGDRIGETVDPLRFRANIYFDGWPAWRELDLVGETIAVGPVRLRVLLRTKRCAATTVNPATGQRDIFVPRHLTEAFGHADLGIYGEVLQGGTIAPGDGVSLV